MAPVAEQATCQRFGALLAAASGASKPPQSLGCASAAEDVHPAPFPRRSRRHTPPGAAPGRRERRRPMNADPLTPRRSDAARSEA
jgi:hypothetical protein